MAAALPQGMKNLSLDDNYLLVAAIDFGTTFSAYAFSFRSSEKEIKMNKNWGAEVSCESYKAPTCVLTNGGKFQSFGYEAEHDYNQLNDEEDEIGGPTGYNLYRHFKMMLHEQGAKISSTVTSTTGHVTEAIDIFAMALRYLKDHMLNAINKSVNTPPTMSDIRWVLTVPAIWSDESKRFMREAAFRGGLIANVDSKNLLIALEPEAASVYCRQLEIDHFATGVSEREDVKFKTGDKMLIIDAGGGTVDITAHEVQITGDVKEIAPPSGGPWGGIYVDAKFVTLLTKILGADFINRFKDKMPQQWVRFMTNFEKAKKAVKSDGKSSIRLEISYSFESEYREIKGRSIGEAINGHSDKEVSFNNGVLIVKNARMSDLFNDISGNIVTHVQKLISNECLAGLKHILLVGGFGECSFLQDACQKVLATSQCKVLVPMEAQLAIIKGAVLFGHNPMQVTSRIAKMTYGCETQYKFKEGVHDASKRVQDQDGSFWCKDIFDKFVKAGQEIKTGSSKSSVFHPFSEDQTAISFVLYKTERKSVTYIDEPGVIRLGEIRLESPSGPLGEDIEVRVTFGHTEMVVEARDVSKGDDYPVCKTIDFLSE